MPSETPVTDGRPSSSHDSQNGPSTHAATAESQPGTHGRRGHHESGPARPEGPAPSPARQGQGNEWTQADRDRVRALYEEDFGPRRTAPGRDRGVNVVGKKPVRSPGDTSDLPPTGEQLAEMENQDAPRVERARNMFDRDFHDFSDAASNFATTARQILEQPPPTGHPGVMVDTHSHWAPESAPNATPSVEGIIEVAFVAGVLVDQAIHRLGRRISDEKERAKADASNR